MVCQTKPIKDLGSISSFLFQIVLPRSIIARAAQNLVRPLLSQFLNSPFGRFHRAKEPYDTFYSSTYYSSTFLVAKKIAVSTMLALKSLIANSQFWIHESAMALRMAYEGKSLNDKKMVTIKNGRSGRSTLGAVSTPLFVAHLFRRGFANTELPGHSILRRGGQLPWDSWEFPRNRVNKREA